VVSAHEKKNTRAVGFSAPMTKSQKGVQIDPRKRMEKKGEVLVQAAKRERVVSNRRRGCAWHGAGVPEGGGVGRQEKELARKVGGSVWP